MNATKEIANTILNQLGGNKFIVMTGTKYFTCDNNSLSFHFPARSGANGCKITLNAWDTYTVKFFKVRGTDCAQVKEYTLVYCDQLQKIFTAQTGLQTSLG